MGTPKGSTVLLSLCFVLAFPPFGHTYSEHECRITDLGAEYNGRLSHAENGEKCKNWTQTWYARTDQDLHALFPEGNINHNYCRNPGGVKSRPWCFLDNPGTTPEYEYCDIPFCPDEFTKTVCTRQNADMRLSCPYPSYGQNNLMYVSRALYGLNTARRKKRTPTNNGIFNQMSNGLSYLRQKRWSGDGSTVAQNTDACYHNPDSLCTQNATVDLYRCCMTMDECSFTAEQTDIPSCSAPSEYLTVDYQCLPGDASNLIDICSDIQYETDTYGYLVTPGYPRKAYDSSLTCTCKLETTSDGVFEADILDFDLELDLRCRFDYVSVSTDDQYGNNKFCGTLVQRELKIFKTSDLMFTFSTDDTETGKGLWIKYRSCAADGSSRPMSISCGNHVTATSSETSSTRFPTTPSPAFMSSIKLVTASRSTNVISPSTMKSTMKSISHSPRPSSTDKATTRSMSSTNNPSSTQTKQYQTPTPDVTGVTSTVMMTPEPKTGSAKPNISLIAGLIVGGLIVLVLVVLLTLLVCKIIRRKKQKDEQKTDVYTNQYYSVKKADGEVNLSGPEPKARPPVNQSKEHSNYDNVGDENLYEVVQSHPESSDYTDTGYLDPQSIEVPVPPEKPLPKTPEKEYLAPSAPPIDNQYLQLQSDYPSAAYQDLGSQEANSYQALARNVSSNSHSYQNVDAVTKQ